MHFLNQVPRHFGILFVIMVATSRLAPLAELPARENIAHATEPIGKIAAALIAAATAIFLIFR